jgi:uroporphyrinogen decarboxylase
MRRDEVFKAVDRAGPAYVPIYFVNRDQDQSDLVTIEVQHHFQGQGRDHSEWGFRWERLDDTMGQPKSYLLQDEAAWGRLKPPELAVPERFREVPAFSQRYFDRFRIASLGLSGFTTMWCLRGFDRLILDLVDQPDKADWLAEMVFGFEERLIAELSPYGFDAVSFYDDWGTQKGMIISPEHWRRVFKPRYAHQFELVHRLGLRVYFHCCGQIQPIIPDLIEVGVDILNLAQPNLYDIPELGRRFGGQVCFLCPVSYQTTSITGTRAQIFQDVRVLVESLGQFNGGLLGYVEEYQSIGLSEANYQACVDAFRTLGQYERPR